MIESLSVNNFKCLTNLNLPELRQVNLIIGPNSSGKSSLLQSVFLFCLDADPRGLTPLAKTETEETDLDGVRLAYKYLFNVSQSEVSKNISVGGVVDGVRRQVSLRDIKNEIHKLVSEKVVSQITYSEVDNDESNSIDINDAMRSAEAAYELRMQCADDVRSGRVFFSHKQGIVAQAPQAEKPTIPATITSRIQDPRRNLAVAFDEVDSDADRAEIVSILRSMDPRVKDIRIGVAPGNVPVVRVVHGDLGTVPIHYMGDGFAMALKYSIETCRNQGCIILDEFDSSLHVNTISRMAEFFSTRSNAGSQLFLSTHRGDTVGSFVQLLKKGHVDLAVIQLRRFDGEVMAQVYSGDLLLSAWDEMQIDLRVPS